MNTTPDPQCGSSGLISHLWKRPLAVWLCLAPLALLLTSGCNNNPYPPDEAHRPILYRAIIDDPKRLDPSISYTVDESEILSLICNSYFQYHPLKQSPFVLELGIGAVMPTRKRAPAWIMVKGRKTPKVGELWSFRLKPGLHYQDDPCFPRGKGREVVASDIVYSFKRMADPKVPCPVLSFFEDKLVGLQEYHDHQRQRAKQKLPADYTYPLEGLQTDPSDKYAFRILLNQPYPQLRYLMAMNFTSPIPREAVERYGPDFRRRPVGCGPFVLAEWTPKLRIVLKRNPNFRVETYPSEGDPGDREAGFLADAGKRVPMVEGVVYTILKENVTGWNLFLQGYMDAWSVPKESFAKVVSRQGSLTPDMTARGIRMDHSREPNVWYYAFNMKDATVGGYTPEKRKLRQAISMAMDVPTYIDLFDSGLGTPAQSVIPPGIFGYEKEYRNPYRQFNVTRAKQLLAEAGYPDGIDEKTGERLSIYFDNTATDASQRQTMLWVIDQFQRIGIRLVARVSRYEELQDRVDKGQFQFIHYGWFADYPDPENFEFLLYGPNIRPGVNAAAYDNPAYNRLFEQMRSMDDGPERLAIIRRMRDIVAEDCPWVFSEHGETLGLHYDWVTNAKPHSVALDGAKYRGLDTERRARLREVWNPPHYSPLLALAALLVVGSLPAVFTVRSRRSRRLRRGG
jgi:oligopeptide transport system substrate-binding protein